MVEYVAKRGWKNCTLWAVWNVCISDINRAANMTPEHREAAAKMEAARAAIEAEKAKAAKA